MSETTNERRDRGQGRIFRRPNSRYFWCQYYDARGAQIRVSTETEDEKKAEKFLRKKIGEVAAGVHHDTRRIAYDELRDAFYADYVANDRKSLRRDRDGKPRLDKVVRLDSFFCGYRASDIDADVIRRFITEQRKLGLANGTINRSISALRRMFNLARKDGKLRDIPYFPTVKEAAARNGFIERREYEALSQALPDYLRLPLALGFFTAMREGEILKLRWNQVNFLSNVIRLRAGETKNDQGREIPIVPQLLTLLQEQHGRRQPGCDRVCFHVDRAGHAAPIQGFRKAWYAACIRCGLGKLEPVTNPETGEVVYGKPRPDRKNPKPKAKTVYQGLIFHDLRRSGVRNLVRAGIPERVAMAISGHKTRSVFERYNIVSPGDVQEAARKLTIFHDGKVGDISGTEEHQNAAGPTSVN
jgi:integrase